MERGTLGAISQEERVGSELGLERSNAPWKLVGGTDLLMEHTSRFNHSKATLGAPWVDS
jgi:hypothetical protein